MGIAVRRKNRETAGSRFLNIPKPLKIGEESTIAADRLFLADVRGEIPEGNLLEFLEKIEPLFWRWWEKKKGEGGGD